MTGDDWRIKPMDALDAEEMERVLGIVERMPPRTQKVVRLRKMLGYTQAEIAADLGITMREVEEEIARGVRFMADQMEIRDGH
jgi:RNA polymerase sigma factor (sigma-70 family)